MKALTVNGPPSLIRMVRYGLAGVINTIIGLSAIFSFKFFLGAGDIVANLAGYLIGFASSYAINSRWTFQYSGSMLAGISKYLLVIVIAYFANLLTVLVSIRLFDINSYLAHVIGIIPYTVIGYVGGQYFAFSAAKPAPSVCAAADDQD